MTVRPFLVATMTAALVTASLPASAETPPPAVPPPAAPPPAQQAYPPGYAPPPPGAYYAPPPGAYYGPPPGAYYAPPPSAYYAQPGYYGPGYVPRLSERRSTGMMIAGIVSIGVGGVFLLTGAALAAIDSTCDPEFEGCPGTTPGIAVAVAGGVLLLVGIPLTVVGAQRVPVGQAAAAPAAPTWLGEPWLKVGDAHAHTPTAAGWRWQF